ncbi:MAG: hypothetical protein U0586_13625 [Candidatus Brocadiaceae bacterium]
MVKKDVYLALVICDIALFPCHAILGCWVSLLNPTTYKTDTAPFCYLYYRTQEDTPKNIDYDRLAYVVSAPEKVVAGLAGCMHED